MTKEQKVSKFLLRNGGGYIHNIGNGMYLIIRFPLDFCGLLVDSSRISVTSNGDMRQIHNIYFTINPNWSIEGIIQAILIGDSLYKVNNCLCEVTAMSPAGYAGRYHIIGQEIYGVRNKQQENFKN